MRCFNSLFPILLVCLLVIVTLTTSAWAHHVLGRPAYSLNEDSNTPPSMQLETQIGHYLVTIMAFPAFPKVGEESRIRLYATHLDSGEPFLGEVHFFVRDDVWLGGSREVLGKQRPTDGIYRQAMVFAADGDYLVTASFEAAGEPYIIDLPIRIGNPASYSPLFLTLGIIGSILIVLALKKRALQKSREAKIVRVADKRS